MESRSYKFSDTFDDIAVFSSPERKLLTAVIERAIYDLFSLDHRTREDARSWIQGIQKTEGLTFKFCLDELDIRTDHSKLVAKILSLESFYLRDRII